MWKLINKWDMTVIILTAVLSLGLYCTFHFFFGSTSGTVNVFYDNRLVATLDLARDETVLLKKSQYPLLLDDLEVEVKDGRVHISKETSPNNICSKQGWTSSPITPLVCLPNHVFVQVVSDTQTNEGVDAVIQ